jgi:hypothetical protein
MRRICAFIVRQEQAGTAFCSYQILRDIAANLDLLIKLNFENAYRVDLADLTRYLTGSSHHWRLSTAPRGKTATAVP